MREMKVAVTGAAGQIGYSLVFRIASGEMFGPGTAVSLRLIETPQALSAVRGVMMELQDCAFPLLKAVSATDDALAGFEGADWALLIGSVPRTAGMERGDLLKINGGIFIEQGKALDAGAGDGCRVLVVGNPCNTNAWIAKSVCRRIPSSRFFAMTLLDQNRAAAQLALKAGAGVEDVSRLAVWGNHSATQYPDFYNARIHGKPVLESIPDEAWLRTEFLDMVQKRGAAVIAARGKSSAASAANAVIGTVKNLESATPDGAFVSVAVSSDGSYGIEEGLMYSFPVRSDGERWQVVQGLPVNDFSRQKLDASADELRMETDAFENMFS